VRLKDALNADDQAACSRHNVEVIDQVCRGCGVHAEQMVRRAYKDSFLLARITSIVMIFIPRQGGFRHRPEEYAAPGDIASGSRVLATAPGKLASE
jgi:ureidoglycolate amidohydrolase